MVHMHMRRAHIHTLEQQRVRAQLRRTFVNGGSLQLFHLLRRHGMHPITLMRRRCAAAVCGYSVSPVRVYMMFFIGGGYQMYHSCFIAYSQFSHLAAHIFQIKHSNMVEQKPCKNMCQRCDCKKK